MPKYFMTWEVDPSRAPIDSKERAILWSNMLDMVKQQIKDGTTIDWGAFVGEGMGYSVAEESEIGVFRTLQKYYPFVNFEVHQVMTVDEVLEALKPMIE